MSAPNDHPHQLNDQTSNQPRRILITGAAGEIGRALRTGLRDFLADAQTVLRLTDARDLGPVQAGEEVQQADLTDLAAMQAVMQGVNAVIHLGGIADEDRYERIRDVNIDGTYHVLEAARQAGVRRVAFASSIHTVGMYPRTPIGPSVPVRPDTHYGISKVYGEALGRMYAEKFGLQFVSVRICSFQKEPQDARHLSTWLSHRDAAQLFARAVTAPSSALPDGFRIVAGISANTRRWMTDEGWRELGYAPQDDAEAFADAVGHIHGDPADITEQRQGGIFAAPDYVGLASQEQK
ncbi:NAD(P)-dependent oxidoreductase [Deinococcus sp. Arct2-2]|uniref:NAD-dependent epimerase/dehydratase family protein n=1 Tax=Deinococcus sp. Arct2-2 TaxID=2568653 RepID=UPI0010A560BF|nr:NAD(P)-dependent oxidoreductase [Deinococcus sp. Arct2-2]THF71067.1 NAD(P)-dependent oxidoreductase [Deinococcus sp. Arct2-2]